MQQAQEKPPGRLRVGEKKKGKIIHNKGAEENHRLNLGWGYLFIRNCEDEEGVLGEGDG